MPHLGRFFARNQPLRQVLRGIAIFVLVLYLPASAVQVLPQGAFWPAGILGIGFLYLLPAVLLLALLYSRLHWPTGVFLWLCVAAGQPIVGSVFGIKVHQFDLAKKKDHLRIMQWNCMGMPGMPPASPGRGDWLAARQMLLKYQPDVICLQDFTNYSRSSAPSSIRFLIDSMGLRYHHFVVHYTQNQSWGMVETGVAIFSKVPILQTGELTYPNKLYPEGICWAKLDVNGKPLLVASTHFQSMHLKRKPADVVLPIFQYQDSAIIYHAGLVKKLRYFQAYHAQQANLLASFLDTCMQPYVLGADLNSVPASHVYGKLKRNRQDAFLEKGFGLGGTYRTRQPGIRIDYLLASNNVDIQQFKTIAANFYDHNPLVMDIILP